MLAKLNSHEHDPTVVELRNAFMAAKRALHCENKRRRQEHYTQEQLALEEAPDHVLLKKIAQKRKQTNNRQFSCQLENTLEAMRSYQAYFQTQLNGPNQPPEVPNPMRRITQPPWQLTTENVRSAIQHTPRSKAAGIDQLKGEVFHHSIDTSTTTLHKLFKILIITRLIPNQWRKPLLCPVWKSKGAPTDISMYRPISLTQVTRKINERCLLIQIIQQAGPLDIAQGGFQRKKGTADQIFVLDTILKLNGVVD
jgi:hypothetical protein